MGQCRVGPCFSCRFALAVPQSWGDNSQPLAKPQAKKNAYGHSIPFQLSTLKMVQVCKAVINPLSTTRNYSFVLILLDRFINLTWPWHHLSNFKACVPHKNPIPQKRASRINSEDSVLDIGWLNGPQVCFSKHRPTGPMLPISKIPHTGDKASLNRCG